MSYLQKFFDPCEPFEWQAALHQKLLEGSAQESIDLPTASGKTFGVIRCWLAAAAVPPLETPRRLVYVVNRRAVADQVFEDAQRIAESAKTDPLREIESRTVFTRRSAFSERCP